MPEFHAITNIKQRLLRNFETEMPAMYPGFKEYIHKNRKFVLSQLRQNTPTTLLANLLKGDGLPDNLARFGAGVETHTLVWLLQQYDWHQDEQPYYNVYPIMEELINNTKLDIGPTFIDLPYTTMAFKFQKGAEPFGVQSALVTLGRGGKMLNDEKLIASFGPEARARLNKMGETILTVTAIVNFSGKPISTGCSVPLAGVYLSPEEVEEAAKNYRCGPVFPLTETGSVCTENYDDQIPEWLKRNLGQEFRLERHEDMPTPEFLQLATLEQITSQQQPSKLLGKQKSGDWFEQSLDEDDPAREHINKMRTFFVKLTALVSLLHNGDADNIVKPILLKKYQKKFDETDDEARKQWFIQKSAQINGRGRGYSVGAELQERAATSPHIRNAHYALYWTGEGRKVPKILKRSMTFVAPKVLTEVPTGFLGREPEEPENENKTEYVYLCRDRTKNLIKIGRTKHDIAKRLRASRTWIPGGISVVGYIPTGDSTALETRLHREYSAKRETNEFFRLDEEEIVSILQQFNGTKVEEESQ